MPLHAVSRRFAVPFALAAFLAFPALCPAQEVMGKGEKAAAKEDPPAETPATPTPPAKAEEPAPEVKGNRYRITIKSGAKIEGVLPQGLVWEKRDQFGDFIEAKETDPGAGLRLNYVLNMDGDIFIRGSDIADVKDLGALTLEQKLAIQEMVLAARRKHVQERDKFLREEMARQAAADKANEKETKGKGEEKGADKAANKEASGEKKESASEADQKKGDDLLAKFPPPEWGQKRLSDILRREIVNGIFRNELEAEFITNFQLWKDALARREKAEAEKAEAEKKDGEQDGEQGGEKGGKKGSGGEEVGGK